MVRSADTRWCGPLRRQQCTEAEYNSLCGQAEIAVRQAPSSSLPSNPQTSRGLSAFRGAPGLGYDFSVYQAVVLSMRSSLKIHAFCTQLLTQLRVMLLPALASLNPFRRGDAFAVLQSTCLEKRQTSLYKEITGEECTGQTALPACLACMCPSACTCASLWSSLQG